LIAAEIYLFSYLLQMLDSFVIFLINSVNFDWEIS
jgi:hypothetical protein